MLQNRELSWRRCGCLEGFSPTRTRFKDRLMISWSRSSRRTVVFFHLKESIPNLQPHLMLRPFQYLTQHFRSVEDIQNQQSTRTQKSLFNPILTWVISGQAYTKPSTWPFHLDGSHNIRTVLDIISHHPAPCLILNCMLNPPQARRERSLWQQHLDARARDFHTTAAEICWQGNML